LLKGSIVANVACFFGSVFLDLAISYDNKVSLLVVACFDRKHFSHLSGVLFSCAIFLIVTVGDCFGIISFAGRLFDVLKMSLEEFKLWKIPQLKDYLRKRGLKISSKKEELVALVYACHVMNVQPLLSEEDYNKDLSKDYASLLFVAGKRMPDPIAELKTGWEEENSARKKWPPTMYGDMVEFMHEWYTCTTSLL
jgi:hypothetical protein